MNIKIKYISNISDFSIQIKQLLEKYDEEFVPPLSSRAKGKPLTDWTKNYNGIMEYYKSIIDNRFIIALNKNTVVGFLSFKQKYTSKHIKYTPCNYVSPIIVDKNYRRMGIATRLYKELIYNLPINIRLKYIVTRTWTMNYSHINLLKKLGFKIADILKNHRGPGIDTIYFYLKHED